MALHEMTLTDGELAAVKAYRASREKAWAAFDRSTKRALEMALLAAGGEGVVSIARRYKRTSAVEVERTLAGVLAILDEYRRRPPASWPADARALLGAVGG